MHVTTDASTESDGRGSGRRSRAYRPTSSLREVLRVRRAAAVSEGEDAAPRFVGLDQPCRDLVDVRKHALDLPGERDVLRDRLPRPRHRWTSLPPAASRS